MVGSQPPWGGRAHGMGWEQQPPDRREGGLLLAPLMGGAEGGIFPTVGYFSISLTISLLFLVAKSDVALS